MCRRGSKSRILMKKTTPQKIVSLKEKPDRYWRLTTLHERKNKIVDAALPHQQALRALQAQLDGVMPEIERALKAAGLDPKAVYHFNDADLTATLQEQPS